MGAHTSCLPTLAEAAARVGNRHLAEEAVADLALRAGPAGTPWALGLLARSRALLAEGSDADDRYLEAIRLLDDADMPLDGARARLLHGEWLRRARARGRAIEQLEAAHSAFVSMRADFYADRARAELEAAGRKIRVSRGQESRDELTPRERQVAAGAAAGRTNREIASMMYVSEATVAYHLRKVFLKLDVKSRRELRIRDFSQLTGDG